MSLIISHFLESFIPHRDWIAVKHAPANHTIILKLIFSLPEFPTIENHLYAVSDPKSPRYGHHLSLQEVQSLLKPTNDTLYAVDNWLEMHEFDTTTLERSPTFDWIKVETTIRKAEEMLNTKYHVWKNINTNETLVRATQWSLPDFVHEHIDLIHPTTMFGGESAIQPLVIQDTSNKASYNNDSNITNIDPSCNNTITPTCLLELYNAIQYKPQAAHKGNKIAISSYLSKFVSLSADLKIMNNVFLLDQFANLDDLQAFYEAFVPAAVGSSFDVVCINGGENNQTLSEAGPEADLDVQYAFGLTFPTPATVFTTGGSPPFIQDLDEPTNMNEPYLNWIDFVLALPDDELPPTISTSYGFLLYTLADEEQTVPFTFAKVVPEVAVKRFGSGGGFSNYFSRPAYQSRSVEAFLRSQGNENAGLFNPLGRAYPDVAAQADNFQIVLRNRTLPIGGTSAATPTFAAIVALLNDARIANGKPTLGFLNPLFYSNRVRTANGAFNDITIGNNPGCGTQGFSCQIGWDPVTGLGTPNFEILKNLIDLLHS
ncbi:hypothetical protein Clacol_001362 [Clathrus columnatus]|uniref:Peptidase S53 domain-containing protein n=1 Tax=Clathrus columnatus TaxID=1419009 RepID=A0AAV5A0Q1_9AGAM|nr:hypothetical protein Clacol_001362 [Clathrus columnatus]